MPGTVPQFGPVQGGGITVQFGPVHGQSGPVQGGGVTVQLGPAHGQFGPVQVGVGDGGGCGKHPSPMQAGSHVDAGGAESGVPRAGGSRVVQIASRPGLYGSKYPIKLALAA